MQYFFGMSSIAVGPMLGEGDYSDLPNAEELRLEGTGITPIKPVKPKSPEQAQIDSLKARKDQATQALKAAQQRHRVIKAQRALQSAMRPTLPK